MQTPYVVGDGDTLIQYSCINCAIEWAEANKLVWNNPNSYNFTEESPDGAYAYGQFFSEGEADTPVTCDGCGQFLAVSLTEHGIEYIKEYRADGNPFPKFVEDYYLNE